MQRGHLRLFVVPVVGALLGAGAWAFRTRIGQDRPPGRAGTALEAAIAEVQAGRRTTPLIGEATAGGDFAVTFLARSIPGEVPRIVSDVTGWGENAADNTFDFTIGRMARVGQTGWYSLETRVAPGARVEYLIVYGQTDYRVDPHNPGRTSASGSASEFVTPGYHPPEEFPDAPAVPAGATTEATVESRALRGSRRVIVYTPPGYRREGRYPVAVFHHGARPAQPGDGSRAPDVHTSPPAIEPVAAPRMLDHLIARRQIEPIVAVFVESRSYGDRQDYTDADVRRFLASELPAWIASRYGVTTNAARRGILGLSYDAKDVLGAAVRSREAFDRVGLLIPGRRLGPADVADIAATASRRSRPLRVTVLAGQYDRANLPTARLVRDALAAAGHPVDYIEVPEGHTPGTWRNHMAAVLVSMFGGSS